MSEQTKHYQGPEHALPLELIDRLSPMVDSYEAEVRLLLPRLPEPLQYSWFNEESSMVVPGYATGGWAYSASIVSLAIDRAQLAEQAHWQQQLRETVFHELTHIMQPQYAYVDDDGQPLWNPLLGSAIYEGVASVFEATYARPDKSLPYYADYTQCSPADLKRWTDEIYDLSQSEEPRWELQQQWSFYHDQHQQHHLLYKVGTYLVTKALDQDSARSVADYASMPWRAILAELGSL